MCWKYFLLSESSDSYNHRIEWVGRGILSLARPTPQQWVGTSSTQWGCLEPQLDRIQPIQTNLERLEGWKHSHLLLNEFQTRFILTIQILPAKVPPSCSGDGCIPKTKFHVRKQSQKSFLVPQTHTFQAEIRNKSENKPTAREVTDTFSCWCLNIIRSDYQAWSCHDIWEVPRDNSSDKLWAMNTLNSSWDTSGAQHQCTPQKNLLPCLH